MQPSGYSALSVALSPGQIDEFEKRLQFLTEGRSKKFSEVLSQYSAVAITLHQAKEIDRLRGIQSKLVRVYDIYSGYDQPDPAPELVEGWMESVREEVINKNEVDRQKLAQEINEEYGFANLNGVEFLRYDDAEGYWKPDAELFIGKIVRHVLPDESTQHIVNEVCHWIKDYRLLANPSEFEKVPDGLINMPRGVFNIRTGKLEPHNPDYHFRYVLPFNYNHRARKSKFMKVLSEITEDDPRKAVRVLEMFAWVLIPGYPIQKAIALYGNGNNGKSVILGVLSAFVGSLNVSGVTMQQLCDNRFAAANLRGALANISGDVGAGALLDTSQFKQATGGDRIDAEKKGVQEPLRFWNTAKMIFSFNTLPRTRDTTNAYFRRFELIELVQDFEGREDKKLLSKLTTEDELQSIFNTVSSVFLPALLDKLEFEFGKKADEIRTNYELNANSALAFIDERIAPNSIGQILSQDLYAKYTEWCKEKGVVALSEESFGSALIKLSGIEGVFKSRKQENGVRKNYYVGISLTTPENDSNKPKNKEETPTYGTFEEAVLDYISNHFKDRSAIGGIVSVLPDGLGNGTRVQNPCHLWQQKRTILSKDAVIASPEKCHSLSVPMAEDDSKDCVSPSEVDDISESNENEAVQTDTEKSLLERVIDLLTDCTYNTTEKFRSVQYLAEAAIDGDITHSTIYEALEEGVSRGQVVKKGAKYGFKCYVGGDST